MVLSLSVWYLSVLLQITNFLVVEEKTIIRQISAFKESVIKRLDELEKSALLEMQTASQDSISQPFFFKEHPD
jgi:hypothetical protein